MKSVIDFHSLSDDIKFSIVRNDELLWIWLALRDARFYKYSRKNRLTFIKLFNTFTTFETTQTWKLFDKIYRHCDKYGNEQPAVVRRIQTLIEYDGMPLMSFCRRCMILSNTMCDKHKYAPEFDITISTCTFDGDLVANNYVLIYYKDGARYKMVSIDWFHDEKI